MKKKKKQRVVVKTVGGVNLVRWERLQAGLSDPQWLRKYITGRRQEMLRQASK